MKIFGNGDKPSLELIIFIVGINFIKSLGKCPNGNILGVIFILGPKHLKAVNVVPKVSRSVLKAIWFPFCLLYNLLDGIVGFQK